MFGKNETKKAIDELELSLRCFKSSTESDIDEIRESLKILQTQVARLAEGKKVVADTIRKGLPFDEITSKDLEEKVKANPKTLVVDVRTDQEWQMGHIAEAIHIELQKLEHQLDQIQDKTAEVNLVCAAGGRSATAAAFLVEKGYENVVNVAGGMSQYRGETVQG